MSLTMSQAAARIGLIGALAVLCGNTAMAQSVSLTAIGTPYTQDFNTLATTGTSTATPVGWALSETLANANTTYAAGTGSDTAGNTYSFGLASSSERAFGGLQSGTLIPTIGASFTNNTGATVNTIDLAYVGEQWRLGATGRTDRLDFQYSLTATSLTTGSWIDVNTLDFNGPISTGTVGALDGNAAVNRSSISASLTGLSIPPGSTFWIRWNDFNASGSDDGLAVDDFSLTPQNTPVNPTLTIGSVSLVEGNAGPTTFSFTVTLSGAALAGGVTFDIATGDQSATVTDNDYVAASATAVTIPEGQSAYTFDVTVNGDTNVESNETFAVTASNITGATPSTVVATGTIAADDVGPAILTTAGVAHTQNFDALANSGTANLPLLTGWFIAEGGSSARVDGRYTADNGGSNAGDTYSYGATASTDRAFGTLRSGTITPTIGALFENQTGVTITRLEVAYTGEEWRLGSTGRADRLDFQYSVDATSLTSGTWTDVDDLDFGSPFTTTAGVLDGNAAGNRTSLSRTIVGLSIPSGGSFWLRWTDLDASGADDGLAVDDFSIVPNPLNPSGTGLATPSDLFIGDDVLLTVTATPGASPINSVVIDLTSIGGSATQPLFDDGTNGDATANDSVFNLATTVAAGATLGSKLLPVTITDTDARIGTTTIGLTVSATPTCTPTQTISQIQGSGPTSPFAGQTVTTDGVVYARRSNGFYIQMAIGDGDPASSDGVFVFTGSTPTSRASIGNLVCVAGVVSEFVPAADPFQAPLTEIGSPVITRLASGQSLPAPTPITTATTSGPNIVAQLEALEGMRVTVPSLTVVGPTLGNINEPNAIGTATGVFFGVVTGIARPVREAGIDANDPKPTCAAGVGCAIPTFDTNPERLRVVSSLLGAPQLDVSAGTVITGLTGPLDYGFRAYTIGPESTTGLGISGSPAIVAVPAARPAEITVASQNLERFFDDIDDPQVDEPQLTTEAYQRRLAKASRVIREVLRSPDIVSLVEIENQATVDALAARINQDAVAGGSSDPQYVGYLEEGNDIGGIDVAFLVKTTRITVLNLTQFGKDATFVNPVTGNNDTLNDRPPLVLEAQATRPNGDPFTLTVIANHLRSLNDVETPRVQAKRRAQAEYLANLVQSMQATNPQARILLVGDFNAFDVNDGYVDVIGTISGIPTPPEQVAAASPDLVDPNLTNLNLLLPPSQRYSYVFDGNAQTLDHALASAAMVPWVSRFAYGRNDADFQVSLYGSPAPARLSDHDGSVTFIDLGTPTVTARFTGAQGSPSGATWVDIEVSNRGSGFAGQVVITEVRFSGLKGSKPVVLIDPAVVGSLAPGQTKVVRVVANLPRGSKFNVKGAGEFVDQFGIVREFVIRPEKFK
jgi:predicted extracellular nuclease